MFEVVIGASSVGVVLLSRRERCFNEWMEEMSSRKKLEEPCDDASDSQFPPSGAENERWQKQKYGFQASREDEVCVVRG